MRFGLFGKALLLAGVLSFGGAWAIDHNHCKYLELKAAIEAEIAELPKCSGSRWDGAKKMYVDYDKCTAEEKANSAALYKMLKEVSLKIEGKSTKPVKERISDLQKRFNSLK